MMIEVFVNVNAIVDYRFSTIDQIQLYQLLMHEDYSRKNPVIYDRLNRLRSLRYTLHSYEQHRVLRMLKYEDLDNNQWIYYNEQKQVEHVEELFDCVH